MKRFGFTQLWLFLLALALSLPAWAAPPQPGLTIFAVPAPKNSSLTLEEGKAYRIGWEQQQAFLNVTISLGIKQGAYRAYLTEGAGPTSRLLATQDGPPASGTPLFQMARLEPASYTVVVVRQGPTTTPTTWDIANDANFVLGAGVKEDLFLSATPSTPDKPYEAIFITEVFSGIIKKRPRFAVTAQWTHDPSVAYGSEKWGLVGPPAATCGFKDSTGTFRFGRTQSPIAISSSTSQFDGQRTLSFNYPADGLPYVIENTGNTIEVPGADSFFLTYNGDRYKLMQFHVHAPSEHTLNGQSYEMEVHLVHQNNLGQVAVVGVLLNGATSTSENGLDKMIKNAPDSVDEKTKADSKIKVDFVPTGGNFYFYNGSLTTPPCTEGVLWIVAADTRTVMPTSVTTLHNLIKKFPSYNNYANNNRPIPGELGARPVFRLRQ